MRHFIIIEIYYYDKVRCGPLYRQHWDKEWYVEGLRLQRHRSQVLKNVKFADVCGYLKTYAFYGIFIRVRGNNFGNNLKNWVVWLR